MIEAFNADIKGNRVFYLSKSAKQGLASVIFIHGFPFSSTMWKGQLEALPLQFNGIAYDIPGFGKSVAAHNFLSIDFFARNLLGLLDSLKVKNPILCGISMGGYIALRAAQISPKEIKGLVLADTNAIADPDEGKLKRFATIEQIQNGGKAEFANGFIKNVFCEKSIASAHPAINLIEEIILSTSDTTLCAAQLALASRTDTSSFLIDINVPALIIRGSDDKLMTPAQASQLHENISGATFASIADAGHLPNLENPEQFNSHLNAFLNKHFLP